jgi:pimeloyl-ACP methyl ester carboxylesterase
MARLGYARYGAQGSDWGTSVSASLGQQDAAHVAGIHLMPPRDIRYWSEPAHGGHFAALEQPALFVDELRACFRLVR